MRMDTDGISGMFSKLTYLIRCPEDRSFHLTSDTHEIAEADTNKTVAVMRKEAHWMNALLAPLGLFRSLPVTVAVVPGPGAPPFFSIHREFSVVGSKVNIRKGGGSDLGYFRMKAFSLKRELSVHNRDGREIAKIKGDWKGRNFQLAGTDGLRIGTISKKWISEYNYCVKIDPDAPQEAMIILMAAALAMDLIYGS